MNIKRFFSISLTCAVMLMTACPSVLSSQSTSVPTTASAAYIDGQTEGTCGRNVRWYLNNSKDVLEIYGTGFMVIESGYKWGGYPQKIKSVIIGNGIRSID